MKFEQIVLAGLVATLCIACEKADREVRHYREINFVVDDPSPQGSSPAVVSESAMPPSAAPMAGSSRMPDLPPELRTPALPLEWDTPPGWENLGGSGMRIATLMVEGQECTILSFPGDVGGDEANIRRWVGQLGHTVAESRLKEFVANPKRIVTVGGYECRLFDFADILPANARIGTLAGIIVVGDHSAFVKLTGDTDVLKRHKSAFEELCRSVRMQPSRI
ncbi:MAG TPA: hypothetical protein PJ991_01780 [Kiritimatiellia bacterium]|nr:hypothetical protein [Kiritimatiellia bacterium]